MQEADVTCL